MKKYISYTLLICIVVCFFLLTENAFAQTTKNANGGSTYVKGITAGRARALAIVLLGLFSLVLALRARKSAAKDNINSRKRVLLALALSLVTIILSVVHLGTSAGAVFGSGSGKAGAIVALLPGLAGTTLSALTLNSKK